MSKKTCFIACPIGGENSPERKNSDFLLKNIISTSLSDFEIVRADLIASSNKITEEIEDYLKNSELVIVDLSSHNPNVFYELGYRHALQRPTITMIKNGESIPFDLSAYRTIHYSELFNDVQSEIKQLQETVSTFDEDDFNFENSAPKQTNLDIGTLNRHMIDIKNELADLQEILADSQQSSNDIPAEAMVRMMELAIENPDSFEKVMNLQNNNI